MAKSDFCTIAADTAALADVQTETVEVAKVDLSFQELSIEQEKQERQMKTI